MTDPVDPKPLADAEASSKLGQLMASARSDVPTHEQLAGLAERLSTIIGPTNGAPMPRGRSSLLKLGVTAGLAALIGGGVLALRVRSGTEPSPSAAPSAPISAAFPGAPSSDARAAAARVPAPADETGGATPGSSSAPLSASAAAAQKARPDGLKSTAAPSAGLSEPRLLEQARSALSRDPATALALTNEAATRFPHGVLAQEREVIAIEALRHLKRSAEADRRAAAFNTAFPGSAHQRVVQDSPSK